MVNKVISIINDNVIGDASYAREVSFGKCPGCSSDQRGDAGIDEHIKFFLEGLS